MLKWLKLRQNSKAKNNCSPVSWPIKNPTDGAQFKSFTVFSLPKRLKEAATIHIDPSLTGSQAPAQSSQESDRLPAPHLSPIPDLRIGSRIACENALRVL